MFLAMDTFNMSNQSYRSVSDIRAFPLSQAYPLSTFLFSPSLLAAWETFALVLQSTLSTASSLPRAPSPGGSALQAKILSARCAGSKVVRAAALCVSTLLPAAGQICRILPQGTPPAA